MAEESGKSSFSNFLKKSASFFSCTRGPQTDAPSTSPPPPPPPPPPPLLPAEALQPQESVPPQVPSSSLSSQPPLRPPSYFTCPISCSLMSEPVAIPSGQSFERSCIQACIDLNILPSSPLILTPNHALRQAIHDWCRDSHHPLPPTVLPHSALEVIKKIKQTHYPPPPSETIQERILREIREPFLSSKHSGLKALIQNPFCTPQILAALLPCLASNYSLRQTLAARALYVLSLDPANLHMIFYSGDDDGSTVTHLLDIISRPTSNSATKFATGVIYKLAVEGTYRCAIGLRWGGVRILLDQFCGSSIGRKKAMLAIFYLCLHLGNLGEVIEAGGVGKLVAMVDNDLERSWSPKRYALILLYDMVLTERGREEMLEGGGIEVLVKRIAECKNGGDDGQVLVGVHCLNVMYRICRSGSLARFREVAAAAGAEEVLVEEVEEWESVGKEIARGIVCVIRGEISEEEELEGELDIGVEVERVENENSDSDDDEERLHEQQERI